LSGRINIRIVPTPINESLPREAAPGGFFGVAPIFHGSALVFGVFSYCGRIEVTFVSCRRVVRDPAFLGGCVQAKHDQLLACADATTPIEAGSGAKTKRRVSVAARGA
jgi:hypothetical protein